LGQHPSALGFSARGFASANTHRPIHGSASICVCGRLPPLASASGIHFIAIRSLQLWNVAKVGGTKPLLNAKDVSIADLKREKRIWVINPSDSGKA
jgi:hypothetical protein